MRTIDYHLPDELLMAYAAGTTHEAESLMVATHLTYCPVCREKVASFEEIGAAAMNTIESEPLPDDLFSQISARIDAADAVPPAVAPAPVLPEGTEWPAPLAAYLDGLKWQRSIVGVELIELPLRWSGEPVRIFRLPPGFKVPEHTHAGDEYQLVLTGGFQDMGEHYRPGDVAVRNASHQHHLDIDPGEPCITLNVIAGRLIPKTLIGRVMRFWTGL